MKFKNRYAAGVLLAQQLTHYVHQKNIIVLALPRGGVVVAAPVAEKLNAPLDLCLVKKLGVPYHEELAMGAIAMNSEPVLNNDIITQCDISKDVIEKIILEKQKEIATRNKLYRNNRPTPDVQNKIVIIIDDGIATGATVRAAISAIQSQHPQKIILAVPVADKTICGELLKLVDEVICLYQPDYLGSVGYWYEEFAQVTDEEVISFLHESYR